MSDLINNKDAMVALANGREVEFSACGSEWDNALNVNIGVFLNPEKFSDFKFRLKPQTIKLNNIEVPKPFEPEVGDDFYYLDTYTKRGYALCNSSLISSKRFGAWRTEDEIKQVVEALRQVFKG